MLCLFSCQNIAIRILVSATQLNSSLLKYARCDKKKMFLMSMERQRDRESEKNSQEIKSDWKIQQQSPDWCWFYCRQAANKLVKLRFLSHTTLSSHVKHDQFRKRRTQCSNFMEIMDELLVLDILRTHEIDFYKLQCEIKLIFA